MIHSRMTCINKLATGCLYCQELHDGCSVGLLIKYWQMSETTYNTARKVLLYVTLTHWLRIEKISCAFSTLLQNSLTRYPNYVNASHRKVIFRLWDRQLVWRVRHWNLCTRSAWRSMQSSSILICASKCPQLRDHSFISNSLTRYPSYVNASHGKVTLRCV